MLLNAQLAAQEALKLAATELTGYIKAEMLAKGAKYVVVGNLPDSAATPFGGTLPARSLSDLGRRSEIWPQRGQFLPDLQPHSLRPPAGRVG